VDRLEPEKVPFPIIVVCSHSPHSRSKVRMHYDKIGFYQKILVILEVIRAHSRRSKLWKPETSVCERLANLAAHQFDIFWTSTALHRPVFKFGFVMAREALVIRGRSTVVVEVKWFSKGRTDAYGLKLMGSIYIINYKIC